MYKTNFKKGLNLVLNLDIRRKEFNPDKFPYPPGETRITFAEKLIEKISNLFSIIKINFQFFADLSEESIKNLVEFIKEKGLIPWVDYKLGDIATTNAHIIYSLNKMGFRGITIHQIIGYEEGVREILENAEKYQIDVISLSYMSHKGADDYFNIQLFDGKKLYEKIIEDGIKWGVPGFVVGATIKVDLMENILKKFPKNKKYFILLPGFGAQEGNYSILDLFKSYKNIIPLPANGREIVYAWMKSNLQFPDACYHAAEQFRKKVSAHYP